jgi:hypothetical protein
MLTVFYVFLKNMYSVFWARKSKITDEFSSQKAVTMAPCEFKLVQKYLKEA